MASETAAPRHFVQTDLRLTRPADLLGDLEGEKLQGLQQNPIHGSGGSAGFDRRREGLDARRAWASAYSGTFVVAKLCSYVISLFEHQ